MNSQDRLRPTAVSYGAAISACQDSAEVHLGVSQNYGYLFGGPHNKHCSILGSLILGNYHLG